MIFLLLPSSSKKIVGHNLKCAKMIEAFEMLGIQYSKIAIVKRKREHIWCSIFRFYIWYISGRSRWPQLDFSGISMISQISIFVQHPPPLSQFHLFFLYLFFSSFSHTMRNVCLIYRLIEINGNCRLHPFTGIWSIFRYVENVITEADVNLCFYFTGKYVKKNYTMWYELYNTFFGSQTKNRNAEIRHFFFCALNCIYTK